ncbi:LysR family transcriptional regulator [Pseudohongiella acticola]|jgi:LysR family transcriptional regulator, hydrogen peroxide-inducible genes activator|uniref:LysR family transcriptional regulator n=1 Tax=Pseudohongiella acticola TaxID=1524254 RepID=A0A1E8CMR1_9GAMM|nr:hydrogen peroxide-inducible genes activator [Pseudohongiella acticola]OFE13693.1 LysR family transcriptional regulator [Pseudohongiella acticola]
MNHLPTTKQLRYFVALEHHEHFGKAAESCFVSQPAFSVAIKELENMLNIQLVDRTNKNVTVTSLGRDIARQARVVLRDLEDMVDIARGNQAPLTGQLKLGVIPTIAPFLLPRLLPALRKSYPELKLYLKEDLTDRVYDRLMDGELDLILVALPYELRNVTDMPLFDDHFFLAHHQHSNFVDPEHYNTNTLPTDSILLLEDGHCLRDHALSACNIRNADKVSSITATSLLTLVQMVDADLGITYLPEMAVKSPLLKNTKIKTIAMDGSSYRQIGLVWRKASTRSDEFAMLGNFIKQHYQAG